MNPFEVEGTWLKAQLHCHTTNSDGEHAPEDALLLYEEAGYDVLAFTDHWFLTHIPSDRLLTLVGAELNADLPARPRGCHVVAIGIDDLPGDETVRSLSSFPSPSAAGVWIESHGGIAHLAHPYWSGLSPEVIAEADGFAAIEVFNGVCEKIDGRGSGEVAWDLALEADARLAGLGVDDAHAPEDVDRAWTWIRAAARTPAAVLEAMRAGALYASNGPLIHEVHRESESVVVECGPAAGVVLHSRYERGASVWAGARPRSRLGSIEASDDAGLITRARLEVEEPDLPYLRVQVRGVDGSRAWTGTL